MGSAKIIQLLKSDRLLIKMKSCDFEGSIMGVFFLVPQLMRLYAYHHVIRQTKGRL